MLLFFKIILSIFVLYILAFTLTLITTLGFKFVSKHKKEVEKSEGGISKFAEVKPKEVNKVWNSSLGVWEIK